MLTEYFTELIKGYKKNFQAIRRHEMYKWNAIQWFRDHWDPDASDFPSMLAHALSRTSNLMDSGSYFPRRMIGKYAEREPQKVRSLFLDLYDEEKDYIDRILVFQKGIREIHNIHFLGRADYQDHRAVIVYLCMRFPDRYFLYKFEMYKAISLLLKDHLRPIMGRTQNIVRFTYLCELLLAEVEADNELILMHQKHLREHDYNDSALYVLTQDIIYAAVNHLPKFIAVTESTVNIELLDITLLPGDHTPPSLKGNIVDFETKNRENRNTGNSGESIIFEFELNKLKLTKHKPTHDAKEIGDGLGYDIKSFTTKGEPMYIEVKATRGGYDTPFFITAAELLKSQKEKTNYYLYRFFDMDSVKRRGKLIIRRGPLDDLCQQPVNYVVRVAVE